MAEKKEQDIVYGSVDPIFDTAIRGKVDAPWRLQRQLYRCNELLSGDNIVAFEASVRAVMGDLPLRIKEAVLARKKEYYLPAPVRYIYTYWCGRRQGTPGNQVLENDPDDWLWYDPKKPIKIKSPIKINDPDEPSDDDEYYIDYETQLGIVKEETERGGISWRHDTKRLNVGEVESPISSKLTKRFTKVITNEIGAMRKEGEEVNFDQAIESQRGLTPPTPTFPKEVKE